MSILGEDNSLRAAMLWTGGKDSVLAFHEMINEGLQVERLVTFVPEDPEFKAHPLEFMELQANALSIPHECIRILEPFRDNYINAIQQLYDEGIRMLITGDIAEVNGQPNWIRECCKPVGMQVKTPLWGRNRQSILKSLVALDFDVILSCVKLNAMNERWLGRKLDSISIRDLWDLNQTHGVDVCGENGEYHSLVKDAPLFKKRIEIGNSAVKMDQAVAYLEISRLSLELK